MMFLKNNCEFYFRVLKVFIILVLTIVYHFCIILPFPRLQKSRFRKAGSAASVILECETREPHTPFSLAVFSLAPACRSNMVRRSRAQKIRLFCSLTFSRQYLHFERALFYFETV